MLEIRRHRQQGLSWLAVLGIVAVVALALWGIFSRIHARANLRQEAADSGTVTVITVTPKSAAEGDGLTLPGTVDAYSRATINARTNGYLKRWLVDIGAPVKAGQLLAEIETPEVDEQLRQAEADLRQAEANAALADTTATRSKALVADGLTSQQDAEEKIGDAAAKRAALGSAKANLARLRELSGFKRVTAPFDGVVTARSIDTGALVTAGSTPLFQVVDARKLRVYVQVPQGYAGSIVPGMNAAIRLADRPKDKFSAKVVSTSNALSASTRTLTVQLALDNPGGTLLPGVYADVTFKLPPGTAALTLPANTLLFRAEGLQVAVLGADDHIVLRKLAVARDLGPTIEVADGVAAGEAVVVNPPDSLVDGQTVRRAPPPEKAQDPATKPVDTAAHAATDHH
jgi:RND family efflux transporter MFP subunit